MIDAVIRAKWVASVARELGMGGLKPNLVLDTDSSAAKSFVARRGLGRMRHIEVRDLWLQQEVAKGLVEVRKIPGHTNPADLMTKYLHVDEIRQRLGVWGLEYQVWPPYLNNKRGKESYSDGIL